MILLGPLEPKFMAEAFVASENVGDGGPGDIARLLELNVNARRERGRLGAMVEQSAMWCEGKEGNLLRSRFDQFRHRRAKLLRGFNICASFTQKRERDARLETFGFVLIDY